jgi:hypothetical protein
VSLFDPDTAGMARDDSNMFVYVSFHIYKNVAQFGAAGPVDRPIS